MRYRNAVLRMNPHRSGYRSHKESKPPELAPNSLARRFFDDRLDVNIADEAAPCPHVCKIRIRTTATDAAVSSLLIKTEGSSTLYSVSSLGSLAWCISRQLRTPHSYLAQHPGRRVPEEPPSPSFLAR
jgi:hypothetical protein